ncbi:MAG: hydratase, partial [Muribaculaceae bacterium]|nr:hydratase [Muribaculaceae bacterium]
PLKLSEFALSRRVPEYVGISKRIQQEDLARRAGNCPAHVLEALQAVGAKAEDTSFGSCVFANRPGDGSAREQAASCQKVLGGDANICYEYATKRYRSNCINWGIVPFTISKETPFEYEPGDMVFIPGLRRALLDGKEEIDAKMITKQGVSDIHLFFQNLTADERQILADGCLMNYYKNKK